MKKEKQTAIPGQGRTPHSYESSAMIYMFCVVGFLITLLVTALSKQNFF